MLSRYQHSENVSCRQLSFQRWEAIHWRARQKQMFHNSRGCSSERIFLLSDRPYNEQQIHAYHVYAPTVLHSIASFLTEARPVSVCACSTWSSTTLLPAFSLLQSALHGSFIHIESSTATMAKPLQRAGGRRTLLDTCGGGSQDSMSIRFSLLVQFSLAHLAINASQAPGP